MGKKGKRAAKAGGGQPKEGTGAARRAKAAAIKKIEEGIDRLIEKLEVELKDKDLFEPAVAKDECPICFIPFGHFEHNDFYMPCCGKMICNGCLYADAGIKKAFGKLVYSCPFCRNELDPGTDEFDQTKKRADLGDVVAMVKLASRYDEGLGAPKDELASLTYLLSAANRGSSTALIGLAAACFDESGIAKNTNRAILFLTFAAKMGDPVAHKYLGGHFMKEIMSQVRWDSAELERLPSSATDHASQHCGFAAKHGSKESLEILDLFTITGHLSQQAYEHAETLCKEANEHVLSEERELAKAYEERE